MITEPECNESQANNLGNERFDIAVAMACLHVNSNVLVIKRLLELILVTAVVKHFLFLVLPLRTSLFLNFIDYFCQRRTFNIDDIEAS